MSSIIVDSPDPIAMFGGAQICPTDINILLSMAKIIVAADGGAEHLLSAGVTPTAVIGDFDSLSPAAESAFSPQLHKVASQDTTDLEKVLARVRAPLILGAGFLGGRLDHSFAALNVLVKQAARPIILISQVDCCFAVPAGLHVLDLKAGTQVALLPMAPALVSTTGLKWNLTDARLSAGGVISTSNCAAQDSVTITTDTPLLMTLPRSALDAAIAVVRV